MVKVTVRLPVSSTAAETVRPPLSAKFPTVAAESATGLLKVIATWVRSGFPTAREIAGGSPSVLMTAWMAGSHAAAILS